MIKRLASFVREYRKPALLSPVFVTLEVILEIFIPLYMGRLIDYGIDKGDMGYVFKAGMLLVVLCVASLACGALSGKYASIASVGFGANLRHAMFHHVQSYSFSNIDKFSSSSIVTRLTTDVSRIQNAFMMIIRIAVRSPVMLATSVVMAFRINSSLAIVFLVAIPFLVLYFLPATFFQTVLPLMLLMGFSGIGFLQSYFYVRVFAYYIPSEENTDEES